MYKTDTDVYKSITQNNRGQALMVTLLIMFLLVFLGAVFATLLGRSIKDTERSSDTLSVDYLSQAGIEFASDQLSYGDDLADWRPTPEYPDVLSVVDPVITNGANALVAAPWDPTVTTTVQDGNVLGAVEALQHWLDQAETDTGVIKSADFTAIEPALYQIPQVDTPLSADQTTAIKNAQNDIQTALTSGSLSQTQYEEVSFMQQVLNLLNDPDRYWLCQGYCRFDYGKGRFLLRITYNPTPDDPMSKYIKIESIGRMGIVDPADPTTLIISKSKQLLKYKVAYKAIGITDYARFITNKDRRDEDFSLGTPGYIRQAWVANWNPTTKAVEQDFSQEPYVTQYGEAPQASSWQPGQPVTNVQYGAPIRCNGNLVWNGLNYIWLNQNMGDSVEVSGDIKYNVIPYTSITASTDASGNVTDTANYLPGAPWTYVNGIPTFDSGAVAKDSSGKLYTAFNSSPDNANSTIGDFRDGRTAGDYADRPRDVTRLDPPLIDPSQITGGLNAYRDVTRNSGVWKQYSTTDTNDPNYGKWYNTGQYGWGDGLYINNPDDIQQESSIYTLRGDWTKPGQSQWWNGPYYSPPGVNIELTPYDMDGKQLDSNGKADVPELIITHDSNPNQPEFHWYDENGNPMPTNGERIYMPYPKNGVIFAEGNVRIKGTLPPDVHLTVVSMGTVYIEGNILKYPFDANGKALPEDSPKNRSISLLAVGNVCVNTTQFFGPKDTTYTAAPGADYFDVTPDQPFWIGYSNGTYKNGIGSLYYQQIGSANTASGYQPMLDTGNSKYLDTNNNPVPLGLYVRDSNDPSKAGLTYLNMLVNYWTNNDLALNPYYSLYDFSKGVPGAYNYTSPEDSLAQFNAAGDRNDYTLTLGGPSTGDSGTWRNDVFDLWRPTNDYQPYDANQEIGTQVGDTSIPWYRYFREPGIENRVGFQLDQSYTSSSQGVEDYRFARAAVQPCDIRIEALMYAQDGSFFIIPGEWYNPDTQDSLPAGVYDPSTLYGKRPTGVDDRYPFYGQPLDVRIVIYGAVAENVPASVGDANAWMKKWGWIPSSHGSSTDPSQVTATYRNPLNPLDTYGVRIKTVGTTNIPILQQGLTFIYDRQLSCPRLDPLSTKWSAGSNGNPSWSTDTGLSLSQSSSTMYAPALRTDAYGRMLPVTPKLPVSTQMLYFGHPT